MATEVDEITAILEKTVITGSPQPFNDILQMLPPSDVISRIFARLSLADKLRTRSVCSLWSQFVNETLNIKPLLFDDSADEVLNLGSTGMEIGTLTISMLKTFQYPPGGLGFSRVRSINFIPCSFELEDETTMVEGISNDNLIAFLNNYPDINVLSLHSGALQDIAYPSILQTVELNSLQTLKVSAYNLDEEGFKVSGDILKNTFPSLKAAKLSFFNREDNVIHIPIFYEQCYQFLANHASTLESIVLDHTNCCNERELQWFELLIDHGIPQDKYLDIKEKISKIKVQVLSLRVTHYEGRGRFQFGIELLKAQTNLTCLTIENLAHPNSKVWDAVPRVLKKCSQTLVHVVIQGCFCPPDAGQIQAFPCSCVKNCNRLKCLRTDICGLNVSDIEELPKQIQSLSLGQMLTRDQIAYVSKNMKDLTEWCLPQGMSETEINIPKVTAEIFKEVIKLPNLDRLVLRKKSCSYKEIRQIVTRTLGIKQSKAHMDGYIKLTLDHSKFNSKNL